MRPQIRTDLKTEIEFVAYGALQSERDVAAAVAAVVPLSVIYRKKSLLIIDN